jgi:MoxR-like ATPase
MQDLLPHEVEAKLAGFRTAFEALRAEIAKVIVGQETIVEGTLIALIAGGHVLLEGVPGLGKTLMVRTLADALSVQFRRVQFTPDLMPADVIGTNVVAEVNGQRRFEFQPGPVFANVVLADEINRATPKTQSALLEAMQEHAVTIAGRTYPLPQPFFVLATQNPLEMEGTYALPEAELDRFFVKLLVRFPKGEQIESILRRTTTIESARAEPVLDGARICEMGQIARMIPIPDEILKLAVAVVEASHPENERASPKARKYVRYGSSPRGAQAIVLAAKIRAILDGRYHVDRVDIAAVAHATLRHRLILNFEGQAENVPPDDVITDILANLRLTAPGPGESRRTLTTTLLSALRMTPPPVPRDETKFPAGQVRAGTPAHNDETRPPEVYHDETRPRADRPDGSGSPRFHDETRPPGAIDDQTRGPLTAGQGGEVLGSADEGVTR